MCGVIGVIGSKEAAKEAFLGLITLQHRGQDAAGILTYDKTFHMVKNVGLVENVFTKETIEELPGEMAIAHTRYSTVGSSSDIFDVQPLLISYPYGIGIVHNGNVVNYEQIKNRLQNEMRRRCLTNSDTETILNWIAHHLDSTDFDSLKTALQSVFENIHGSYSVVGMIGEAGLFAFRDPYGFRPLILGKKIVEGKPCYMVASESIPLTFLGYEIERDIAPGEILLISPDGQMKSVVSSMKGRHSPCMFEWVYFAGAEGEIEKTPVYGVRLELGKRLAELIQERITAGKMEVDIVAPVPDTSRTAATALAEELKLPYREVLIKNRYIKRTFILGTQAKRQQAVDLKLNPVKSELKGKNVILVDDSVVRGTTSKKIVELVKRAGANKVYFVSTCPPIRYPCFYGIDFPDQNELIASVMTEKIGENHQEIEDRIADELGADGFVYIDLQGLQNAIAVRSGGKIQKPCVACLTGEYPSDIRESTRFTALRKAQRGDVKNENKNI